VTWCAWWWTVTWVAGLRREATMTTMAEQEEEEAQEEKQLLFYERLKEEPKAIKCFTGLSQECMDWVMKKLCAAVR
jgi:hypothetical protein